MNTVDLYHRIIRLLATSDLNRNEPSLGKRLHCELTRAGIHLPTENRSMSVRSCEIWINNVKRGRYTYADALKGLRCGRTGAGKR